MATIKYNCDTCKREISLAENASGMTVFSKCIITNGCKGKLYKIVRNENVVRQDGDFPPPVAGLEDYVPRRAFFAKDINISSRKWKIQHNLGVSPAETVYLIESTGGVPIEASPDSYTISIIDSNNLEISFETQQRGIIHLVSRSSVPANIQSIITPEGLVNISNDGNMVFAIPTIIERDNNTIEYMNEDNFTIDLEIQIPSNPVKGIEGEYMLDVLPSSSPWLGWDQVLIRKRRSFSTKNINVLDFMTDAFPNITSLADIPENTSFRILGIQYQNTTSGYIGNLIPIEPRQVFLLYSETPYGVIDKVRNKLVDIGTLPNTNIGRFYIISGAIYLDSSNIESTYPRIEQLTGDNLVTAP